LDEQRRLQKEGKYARRVARNLDAAARIKKGEDQLRQTTRDLSTPVDGGIFEHLL
jgi:hypothetical protein